MDPSARSGGATYRSRAVFNKLSAFHASLEQALKADSLRAKQNPRSAKALFAQIKAEGAYDGGYSQLSAFIRAWRGAEGKVHAFVPLTFTLGEAFQFDWSEEGLLIGGIYRRMQVSHLKLCASRAFRLRVYPSQGWRHLRQVGCVYRTSMRRLAHITEHLRSHQATRTGVVCLSRGPLTR